MANARRTLHAHLSERVPAKVDATQKRSPKAYPSSIVTGVRLGSLHGLNMANRAVRARPRDERAQSKGRRRPSPRSLGQIHSRIAAQLSCLSFSGRVCSSIRALSTSSFANGEFGSGGRSLGRFSLTSNRSPRPVLRSSGRPRFCSAACPGRRWLEKRGRCSLPPRSPPLLCRSLKAAGGDPPC